MTTAGRTKIGRFTVELSRIEAVRSSPSFHSLEEQLTYLKAMNSIVDGKSATHFG